MNLRACLVPVVALLLASCGSAGTQASPPSGTSPIASSTTAAVTSTTAAKLDVGEQFLKVLGAATPPSRSHAVEMGRVIAKDVCPKIKYGDQLIVANLTLPLLNAGYGNEDVQWVTTNAQLVTIALKMSFCDPQYN